MNETLDSALCGLKINAADQNQLKRLVVIFQVFQEIVVPAWQII